MLSVVVSPQQESKLLLCCQCGGAQEGGGAVSWIVYFFCYNLTSKIYRICQKGLIQQQVGCLNPEFF